MRYLSAIVAALAATLGQAVAQAEPVPPACPIKPTVENTVIA
jgi:hypothetical protein